MVSNRWYLGFPRGQFGGAGICIYIYIFIGVYHKYIHMYASSMHRRSVYAYNREENPQVEEHSGGPPTPEFVV